MAIPKEHRTEKVEKVRAEMDKMSPEQLQALPPLENSDLLVFGAIVQHYCFIDFNLRGAIEIFRAGQVLLPEFLKSYPDYTDTKLSEVVKASVQTHQQLGNEEALARLDAISGWRPVRNLLSHFAGKRFPNEDVIVFVCKSERDARQVLKQTCRITTCSQQSWGAVIYSKWNGCYASIRSGSRDKYWSGSRHAHPQSPMFE